MIFLPHLRGRKIARSVPICVICLRFSDSQKNVWRSELALVRWIAAAFVPHCSSVCWFNASQRTGFQQRNNSGPQILRHHLVSTGSHSRFATCDQFEGWLSGLQPYKNMQRSHHQKWPGSHFRQLLLCQWQKLRWQKRRSQPGMNKWHVNDDDKRSTFHYHQITYRWWINQPEKVKMQLVDTTYCRV